MFLKVISQLHLKNKWTTASVANENGVWIIIRPESIRRRGLNVLVSQK